ncbi:hypothetical protein LACR_2362 [Lactococcus cremoris subsp. cremoris SK11]|uniref:Uncharacterized protein n=1 Tax=Lactococcus lactis subsp. cremoris (strain SK11) TaxID=272622 RepID=Q02W61_LACLS|nr:hypothetical protein LACR_2362 [Lactococcus cremoris subsp. cremoris SK11]ADJ61312.1 hypothetical protein LLNZ_12115 [Lactococcus cremoris subsp. cremoris NZ9000]
MPISKMFPIFFQYLILENIFYPLYKDFE